MGMISGTITPAGPVTVNDGATQSFLIQSGNSAIHIHDVLVDGKSVFTGTPDTLTSWTYQFPAVHANHTLTATFLALQQYSITVTVNGGGATVSPPGSLILVASGHNQDFTITVPLGSVLNSAVIDGTPTPLSHYTSGTNTIYTYTFSNVQANHTLVINTQVL